MIDIDLNAEVLIEELPALPGAEFDEEDDAAGILLGNNNITT